MTGGGSGLGRALSLRLAEAGIDVWIAGRRPDPLEETRQMAGAHAGKIHPYPCDLRDPKECEALVAAAGAEGTGMLINNAAGAYVALAEDISPKGWRAVLDSTLNAPFYMTLAWGQKRIASGKGGVILNIASATTDGGSPGTLHSGAAKSGLVSMTKTLATEWARYGIRSNALSPGPFQTPGAADQIWSCESIRRRVQDKIPLGYIAPLDEIVEPGLFLLSRAARYTNGSILKVDGGWTLTDWLYINPNEGNDDD